MCEEYNQPYWDADLLDTDYGIEYFRVCFIHVSSEQRVLIHICMFISYLTLSTLSNRRALISDPIGSKSNSILDKVGRFSRAFPSYIG
jgi:hypothetical protein